MKIQCVWEHNGNDTLLYAATLPGAYTRGASPESALRNMEQEASSYLRWAGMPVPDSMETEIIQDASCDLQVRDADSDVLFNAERGPLSQQEYANLKALVLKSAEDFHALYESVPDKDRSSAPPRTTFYGPVPRTAREMYDHTKNVNAYYFGEVDVDADNEGSILQCRIRGFEALERKPDFLKNETVEGSYGEYWNVRKMLRRFLWHDRIHAKAMYRMAVREFGETSVCNPFFFKGEQKC